MFSKKKLREFFIANPKRRFNTCDHECCPIAVYLRTTYSVKQGDVSVLPGYTRMKNRYFNHPRWAINFIERVDSVEGGEAISGKAALEILDNE